MIWKLQQANWRRQRLQRVALVRLIRQRVYHMLLVLNILFDKFVGSMYMRMSYEQVEAHIDEQIEKYTKEVEKIKV